MTIRAKGEQSQKPTKLPVFYVRHNVDRSIEEGEAKK